MIIVKADKIKKTYGSGELMVEALKETSLELEAGYFYSIIGKSGSGKSTLLHILGGLDRPTSGTVLIDGEDVFRLPDSKLAVLRRKKIGFIFQAFNLLPEHTVFENIMLPLYADGRVPEEEHFNRVIEALGIREKLKYYPSELSGGQQQRVAIARALAAKPAIILADEPTGNLDAANGAEVLELLKRTAAEFHQTIIMVTHDMEIAHTADRVITIADGRVVSVEESSGEASE